MAIKTKTFTLLGFILVVACLVALIIAFASDRWVVSTEKEVSGFKNIGLWSACFSRYRPPAWALIDKYYDGCWWVFDREMDDLRHFLFPPWFVGTQVLVTLSLTFQLIAIVLMIVNAINCFPYNKFKDVIALGLSITSAILHAVTAILLIVAVIMFGARADNERTWLEKPDQNYLSWSFGLCVLAAFLSILTSMTVAMEFYRLRLSRSSSNSEPQLFITNVPPPAPSYAYSSQKFQPSYFEKNNQIRHPPAYVNKYQDSRSSLSTKPPGTLFAVSGAGEVYVNRSYVNDENLPPRGRTNGYVPRQHPQAHQERKNLEGRSNAGNVDAQLFQHSNAAPKDNRDQTNDYEMSKKMQHPVLPEYTPKMKSENVKKIDIDNTLDDSCDTDIKKAKKELNAADEHERKRAKSDSKSTKSTNRSSSKTRKKKQKADVDDDNVRNSMRRSKTQNSESDEEHSHVRGHSKKRTSQKTRKKSHSRERTSSRHRNKSRDLNLSCSDSLSESDSISSRSRSRQKERSHKSSSRKSGRKRSESKESKRKEKHGSSKKGHERDYTDDASGSELSSKQTSKRTGSHSSEKKKAKSLDYSDTESVRSRQRSKKRGDQTESGGKTRVKARDFSDTESVRSKQRSKSKDNQVESNEKTRAKAQDYSDNESMRSKQSRRGDHKPKGTYSSYYEY